MGTSRKAPRWAMSAFGVGFLAIGAIAAGQGKPAALAGTWKLNSEKTREAAAEARRKDPEIETVPMGFRSSGGGTGSGGSGRSGTSAGGGVPSIGPVELGPLKLYTRPLPQLVIEQTDSTISITDVSGTPRIYYLDGRKQKEPLPNGESMETVAKLKDGKLTTDRKIGPTGSVREVFSVDADSHRLVVELKITGPAISPPITQLWFYDAVPAGGSN